MAIAVTRQNGLRHGVVHGVQVVPAVAHRAVERDGVEQLVVVGGVALADGVLLEGQGLLQLVFRSACSACDGQ